MSKILVFAPHPDDDIIGCGGSMAKHISQGNRVQVVYLTSGEAGSHKYSKAELAVIREGEARQATASLGIKDVNFLGMPDGFISYTRENLLTLVMVFMACILPRPWRSYPI
jgi:LmbE family N-acetylglucosaminyl deacetylase